MSRTFESHASVKRKLFNSDKNIKKEYDALAPRMGNYIYFLAPLEGNGFTIYDSVTVESNDDVDLIKVFKDYEKTNYYPFNAVLIYNDNTEEYTYIDENYNILENLNNIKCNSIKNSFNKILNENTKEYKGNTIDFEFKLRIVEVEEYQKI